MQGCTLFVFSRRMVINHFGVTTRLAVSHMCRHSTLVIFGSIIFLFGGAEQEILTGVPLGLSCVFHLREHLGSQVACQVPGHRGTSRFLECVHWCHTGCWRIQDPGQSSFCLGPLWIPAPQYIQIWWCLKTWERRFWIYRLIIQTKHLKQSAGWSYRLGELKRFQEKRGSAAWSWSWRMKDTQRRRKACCWDLWRGFKRDYRVWFSGSRDTVSLF